MELIIKLLCGIGFLGLSASGIPWGGVFEFQEGKHREHMYLVHSHGRR